MTSGLRKVVHVEVFDFEKDTMAYAIDSGKNQFGYKYRTQYLKEDEVVKESKEKNSVEQASFYYRALRINVDQTKKLRRFLSRLQKEGNIIPFPEEDGQVLALIRGGTKITYRGEHPEDFYQKVLLKK